MTFKLLQFFIISINTSVMQIEYENSCEYILILNSRRMIILKSMYTLNNLTYLDNCSLENFTNIYFLHFMTLPLFKTDFLTSFNSHSILLGVALHILTTLRPLPSQDTH